MGTATTGTVGPRSDRMLETTTRHWTSTAASRASTREVVMTEDPALRPHEPDDSQENAAAASRTRSIAVDRVRLSVRLRLR
ncbi:hypothetical protein GCM10009623_07070 [Nocardioides aestuarii]